MAEWSELPPPNLDVLDRGVATISSGTTTTVEGVADENDQVMVFYGHHTTSADGTAVTYRLDDDAEAGEQNLVFDETSASGDSVIVWTAVKVTI